MFPYGRGPEEDDEEEEEEYKPRGNNLKLWGNSVTMNINPLVHTNIVQSPYFKTNLIELTTYHEVIDEIYYKVSSLHNLNGLGHAFGALGA